MMSKYHGFHLHVFPLNSSTTNHWLIPCKADLVCSGRLTEIWGSLNILYCYPAEQIKLSNWITSPEPLRCFSERWEWHCFGYAAQIQAQPSEHEIYSVHVWIHQFSQNKLSLKLLAFQPFWGHLKSYNCIRGTVSSLATGGKLLTFVFLSSRSVIMLLRATHGHACPGLLTPVRPTAVDRLKSVVWWSKNKLSELRVTLKTFKLGCWFWTTVCFSEGGHEGRCRRKTQSQAVEVRMNCSHVLFFFFPASMRMHTKVFYCSYISWCHYLICGVTGANLML